MRIWSEQAGFFGQIWSSLKTLWGENGTSIDPNGTPSSISAQNCIPRLNSLPDGTPVETSGTCTSSQ